MPIRHNFEPDIPYENFGDVSIKREIEKYEKENPDYEFNKLEFFFDEQKGVNEIKLSFKHKDINVAT